MNVKLQLKGLTEAIAALNGAGDEIFKRFAKTTKTTLTFGVEYLRVTYRTTRSATSTGIVTGLLRRSYTADVTLSGHQLVGRLGILAPQGKVLEYALVHEFGAVYGRRKARGDILIPQPKSVWRRYGGRPALGPTAKKVQPLLETQCLQDISDVVKRAA